MSSTQQEKTERPYSLARTVVERFLMITSGILLGALTALIVALMTGLIPFALC